MLETPVPEPPLCQPPPEYPFRCDMGQGAVLRLAAELTKMQNHRPGDQPGRDKAGTPDAVCQVHCRNPFEIIYPTPQIAVACQAARKRENGARKDGLSFQNLTPWLPARGKMELGFL